MDEQLQILRRWASHGTMRQFYTELEARLTDENYKLELEGDTLTVYRSRREGGLFGLGGRRVREPVLAVIRRDDSVEIPEEHADPEFVQFLTETLGAH